MGVPKNVEIKKETKGIKITHTVMTRVTTSSNTYDVSISKKGIHVSRRKSKGKSKVYYDQSWETIDQMFNKHDGKGE